MQGMFALRAGLSQEDFRKRGKS